MAVAFRETRVDAQEGRAVDFALPRELPEELLLPVAGFVMAAFVRQDMAVRIDIECPQASDSGRNPHVHGYVAILAGIPVGLTAINTCASADAIRLITKKYPNLLADVIRPFDPCSVVEKALKRAADEFRKAKLTRVEYKLPGSEHLTAEEKERRKSADLLIKNWMALQNQRVQNNSSRGVGGPGALADSPEGKPP